MLRCGKCGSSKFIFTVRCISKGEQHGASCAICGKQLNAGDALVYNDEPTQSLSAIGIDDTIRLKMKEKS